MEVEEKEKLTLSTFNSCSFRYKRGAGKEREGRGWARIERGRGRRGRGEDGPGWRGVWEGIEGCIA